MCDKTAEPGHLNVTHEIVCGYCIPHTLARRSQGFPVDGNETLCLPAWTGLLDRVANVVTEARSQYYRTTVGS